MGYYFIRVNGNSGHTDPYQKSHYIPDEPTHGPNHFFNYLDFCFREDIARIGWPDTGDLRTSNQAGKLTSGYTFETLAPYIQRYLEEFRAITVGETVLVPDKAAPGRLYIGEVTKPYHYYHQVPIHPYECAHRLGIRWDRDAHGIPIPYSAKELGISIQGGFWLKAFFPIDRSGSSAVIIANIKKARE